MYKVVVGQELENNCLHLSINVKSDVFTSNYIINSIHKSSGYIRHIYPRHNSLPCGNYIHVCHEPFRFTLLTKS